MAIYIIAASEKAVQPYRSRSSASETSDSLAGEHSSASPLLHNHQWPRLTSWNPARTVKLIGGASHKCKRTRFSEEGNHRSELSYSDAQWRPSKRRESSDSSSTSSISIEAPERTARLITGASNGWRRLELSDEGDHTSELSYSDAQWQPRRRRESSDSSSTSSISIESRRSERSLSDYSSDASLESDSFITSDYESDSEDPGDLSDDESEPISLEMNNVRISDELELYNTESDDEDNLDQTHQEYARIKALADGFWARHHKGDFSFVKEQNRAEKE